MTWGDFGARAFPITSSLAPPHALPMTGRGYRYADFIALTVSRALTMA